MEPTSLTAAAIAILVATKALEKTGEKLGEKVVEKGGGLINLLRRKSPETAKEIEATAERPVLLAQQPEDYGVAVLEEVAKQVEQEAKTDPEIKAAVEELAAKVQAAIEEKSKLEEMVKALTEEMQAQRQSSQKSTKTDQIIGIKDQTIYGGEVYQPIGPSNITIYKTI